LAISNGFEECCGFKLSKFESYACYASSFEKEISLIFFGLYMGLLGPLLSLLRFLIIFFNVKLTLFWPLDPFSLEPLLMVFSSSLS